MKCLEDQISAFPISFLVFKLGSDYMANMDQSLSNQTVEFLFKDVRNVHICRTNFCQRSQSINETNIGEHVFARQ